MKCPACGTHTHRIMVHDPDPFHYEECPGCGWDDYDEAALRQLDDGEPADVEDLNFEDDNYEPDEGC